MESEQQQQPQKNIWAFLVGTDGDGDEDRYNVGDGALYLTMMESWGGGLPQDHVMFIGKNKECTKANVSEKFQQFLVQIKEHESATKDDVLIFYYGGHGLEGGFHLTSSGDDGESSSSGSSSSSSSSDEEDEDDELWKHDDVISTIETTFHGSTVWLLADCCHSGTLYEAVKPRPIEDYGTTVTTTTKTKKTATTITTVTTTVTTTTTKVRDLEKSYACIMSTAPDYLARGYWTFTEAVIWAIQKQLRLEQALAFISDSSARFKRDRPMYWSTTSSSSDEKDDVFAPNSLFLSLPHRDGQHPLSNGRLDFQTKILIEEDDDDDSESDEDEDETPVIQDPDDPLRFGLNPPLFLWTGLSDNISSSLSVGGEVYVRWQGGRPEPSSRVVGLDHKNSGENDQPVPYIMPLWFLAKIVKINEDENNRKSVDAELTDPAYSFSWKVSNIPVDHLLYSMFFENYHDWAGDCIRAMILMAQNRLRYITYELPEGTRVKVLWGEDGKLYDATVMDQRDEDLIRHWRRVTHLGGSTGIEDYDTEIEAGAFLWVDWDDEEAVNLVPLSRCYVIKGEEKVKVKASHVRKKAKEIEAEWKRNIQTPVDAMLKSMASANKSICSVESAIPDYSNDNIDSSSERILEALSECEGYWYHVKPIALSDVTVRDLAEHVYFDHPGEYCPLYWFDDKSRSVAPKSFVRLRKEQNGDSPFQQKLSFLKWHDKGTTVIQVNAEDCI